jgi:hypothetical protein
MAQHDDHPSPEARARELKSTLDKYLTGEAEMTRDVAADLTRAVHEIADHLVDLHRRLEKIEESVPEWTTRGWMPPPGSDPPHDD